MCSRVANKSERKNVPIFVKECLKWRFYDTWPFLKMLEPQNRSFFQAFLHFYQQKKCLKYQTMPFFFKKGH